MCFYLCTGQMEKAQLYLSFNLSTLQKSKKEKIFLCLPREILEYKQNHGKRIGMGISVLGAFSHPIVLLSPLPHDCVHFS